MYIYIYIYIYIYKYISLHHPQDAFITARLETMN